jgi:hypothetical protein
MGWKGIWAAALSISVLGLAARTSRASVSGNSELFYASATMGTPGQTGGLSISSGFEPGARFTVSSTVTINAIGGHIGGTGSIYGALVRLNDDFDFPDSFDLSTSDVLAHTTVTLPSLPSSDQIFPITQTTLTPGTYGVIYGSGTFGATGHGFMPFDGVSTPTPSFFSLADKSRWQQGGTSQPYRFTVYVTPEPTGLGVLFLGCALATRRRVRASAGCPAAH